MLARFNGKLSEADRAWLEQCFRLFGNQFLHAPISALREEIQPSEKGHTLPEALRKLFRLETGSTHAMPELPRAWLLEFRTN